MSIQSPDLDHFLPLQHSRSQSQSPAASTLFSSHPGHRSNPNAALSLGSADELYRTQLDKYDATAPTGGHTRTSSTASSTFSLSATHLTTPNASPPMDSFSHPLQPSKSFGTGAPSTLGRQTNIRRARHESSMPYTRSSSFSGSESVRSSSSEAEDINVFAFSPHQPADYGMYRTNSNPGIGPLDTQAPPHHLSHLQQQQQQQHQQQQQQTGAFTRMNSESDHQLEGLAANVRAANTTSASDRAKHIFVQAWLNANYAPYPDGNVPRQGLYNSYRRVCDEYRIPHVNTATLGKAIRLCFPAIKTRRLGVRGNSKYHYCGIRPATSAEAEWLQDFIKRTTNHRPPGSRPTSSQSGRSSTTDESPEDDDDDGDDGAQHSRGLQHLSIHDTKNAGLFVGLDDKTPTVNRDLASAQSSVPHGGFRSSGEAQIRRRGGSPPPAVVSSNVPPHMRQPQSQPSLSRPSSSTSSSSFHHHPGAQQTIGHPQPHGQSVRSLPNFPNIEDAIGHGSHQSQHGIAAREVWGWFEDHLDSLLESVRVWRFDQFEMNLRTFWEGLGAEYREIVHAPAVAGLMARADAIVYDEILEILRSQMLTPVPVPTLASLRQLADKMEKVLLVALKDYGSTFVEPKVELGARFGHLVLRFLDIFQVTQALSSVLSNPKQLVDMSRSWRDIDFESIRNQAALVCNCRHEDLHQLLEVDFVAVLDGLQTSPEPVREIMAWSDLCCEKLMGAHGGVFGNGGNGEERATMSSRSLLIRWGYVTSQIMRDLTIRSDPAFGAFQILKLFMDDWIALNVLRSVALSTNSVAASVEPVIQQQFLALSPSSTGQYLDAHHPAQSQHHSSGMINTPTTTSMLAAAAGLHDSFGSSHASSTHHNQHASLGMDFHYDPLSFGSMDASVPGGPVGGANTAPSPADSLMSSAVGTQSFVSDFGAGSGAGGFDFGLSLDPPPPTSTSSSSEAGASGSGGNGTSADQGVGQDTAEPMVTDSVKTETSA